MAATIEARTTAARDEVERLERLAPSDEVVRARLGELKDELAEILKVHDELIGADGDA